jgi:D-aminoacyl-tRNA deacylase
MRVVIQRVREARLTIRGEERARIGTGFVILLGVREGDVERDAIFLADKCSQMRVFEDDAGKMNLSLKDVDGHVLVVSQFTLYADAQKGNRPSFVKAARPETAEPLYEIFVRRMRETLGAERVCTGVFGEMMDVLIVNSGPVTIIVESPVSAGAVEGA